MVGDLVIKGLRPVESSMYLASLTAPGHFFVTLLTPQLHYLFPYDDDFRHQHNNFPDQHLDDVLDNVLLHLYYSNFDNLFVVDSELSCNWADVVRSLLTPLL